MNSQGSSPKTNRTSPRRVSPSKITNDQEIAKKALYSALVLLAKEQIKEKEESQKQPSSDDFWERMQSIISKHEAQMDQITVKAVNIRSKLNNKRLEESKAHSEVMSKSKAQYQKILEELDQLSNDQTKFKITEFTNKQKELQQDINEISSQNVQLTESVQKLQTETDDLKQKLREQSSNLEARSAKIKARRQVSTESANKIDIQINQLTNEILAAENEIEELKEKREMVKQLVDTLEISKSHFQSIFMQNE
ncbi:hypothetical protein TVAG_066640 [Trichomonas vaginalis G3]|uniref:Uncharacterized protein n=1 Tax=Trichomonas vaginalis (strain ATCC PRA-98 / G3) TaxID=412133 RepID=A2DS80_TRIV3|nr:hypothetical protein TVAGG3_0078530 [Trichomonas vaginalis G3]EAY16659.1 hypothetical protein TVAG_066640 [Trichomonas vaginalis G3]KAI5543075.1 hypothetical protein TVAGG3_0078530 [Trichomonas vaginalis G3]|eukprot:XP_001328882.1 hypothetical protein [Trichomonas vaginalis G3]